MAPTAWTATWVRLARRVLLALLARQELQAQPEPLAWTAWTARTARLECLAWPARTARPEHRAPSGLRCSFEAEPGEEGLIGPPGATGPAGAGGGGSATTVEVNLGSTATWRGRFTLTDAAITSAKKLLCWQAPGPYTGKGTRADEADLQPVQVIAVVPASGAAEVFWQTPPYLTQQPGNAAKNTPSVASAALPTQGWFVPTRLGKVRGNVKFTYLVLA